VRVDGGGSAGIAQNHITKIEDMPFSGCQNGVAVQVGRANPPLDDTTGSAAIRNNLIDNYQKNGVTIANKGSSGFVAGNMIRGVGPTVTIAQNGVQISDGAQAAVTGNLGRYVDELLAHISVRCGLSLRRRAPLPR
jgi:hypothetical protein